MRLSLLTTAALACVLPVAAFAQEAPAAGAQASSDSGLADIVVTAQRREENLQRAGIPVDVVQGDELIDAGVTQIQDLNTLTPALNVQPTSVGNMLFIRGVGNFTIAPNSDPANAFNYDGVYVGRPTSTSGVFFDLARVEVLKGPQGTLYGRNTTGGAINVLPNQPRLGEYSGYGTVSFGNYDSITAEGALNLPIGDSTALRIAGTSSQHDGYLDDGTSDEDTQGLRLQLKSEITPNLTVRVGADYSQVGGRGAGTSYVAGYALGPGGYTEVPSGIPLSEGAFSAASQAWRQTQLAIPAFHRFDALNFTPSQDNDFTGINAEITYDAGFGVFTIIPAYRASNLDLIASAAAFAYDLEEEDTQSSLEVRFEGSRIGIFDYTLGAYYFHEDIDSRTALSLSTIANFQQQDLSTDSIAPFARVTANFTDSFRGIVGIRYTHDEKEFAASGTSLAIVCTSPNPTPCITDPTNTLFPSYVHDLSDIPFAIPAGFIPVAHGTNSIVTRNDRPYNESSSDNAITYRIGLEYDLAPQSLVYASFETGYRSGGFSPSAGYETYDPEYLDAYTIGLKNRFFDNRLQLNLEAFYWRYRDRQIAHVGLDTAGNSGNFTQNIGRTTIQGIELEGRYLVTPDTLISADVQYTDSVNDEFSYSQGRPSTAPPLTACSYAAGVNAISQPVWNVDCSGLPAYNAPEWVVNLGIQQTFNLGDYQLIAAADTQYKTERYVGFEYLASELVDPNWSSSARVSFGPSDERWEIQAFVRNIEDERTPINAGKHAGANMIVTGTAAPRTYGLRLSTEF